MNREAESDSCRFSAAHSASVSLEIPSPPSRISAVWDLYGARSEQSSALDRIYALYLFVLFSALYLVPIVYSTAHLPPLVSFSSIGHAQSVVSLETSIAIPMLAISGLCLGSLFLGRIWGPAVLRPFVLHVFTTTDLPPNEYLTPVARRHMWWAAGGLLVLVSATFYMFTDFFATAEFTLLGVGLAIGLSILAPTLWLRGQVNSINSNLKIAGGIVCASVITFLAWLGLAKQVQAGAVWSSVAFIFPDAALAQSAPTQSAIALLVLAFVAAMILITGLLFRSRGLAHLASIDLDRLQSDSARAASAQVFTTTGNFHHAFDLFQPEPKGYTAALIRMPGTANPHLRGHLTQGLIRALRTPSRFVTAGVLLVLGTAGLVAQTGGLTAQSGGFSGTQSAVWWFLSALCLYLGLGKVTGTWKSLLGELSLAPLYGPGRSGLFLRNLLWPLAVLGLVSMTGLSLTLAAARFSWTTSATVSGPVHAAGYFLLTCTLAFGARFLREMKLEIPAKLLYPITTPLGDISGLRVIMWQFDGVLAVAVGVGLMQASPTLLVAVAASLLVCAYCLWMGVRQARV